MNYRSGQEHGSDLRVKTTWSFYVASHYLYRLQKKTIFHRHAARRTPKALNTWLKAYFHVISCDRAIWKLCSATGSNTDTCSLAGIVPRRFLTITDETEPFEQFIKYTIADYRNRKIISLHTVGDTRKMYWIVREMASYLCKIAPNHMLTMSTYLTLSAFTTCFQ